MARAIYNGTVIANSDDIVTVEGNAYFPISSLVEGVTSESSRTTVCPWKGTANYWNLTVDGTTADNAAWYYATPKQGAEQVAGRVAFYPVVTIEH